MTDLSFSDFAKVAYPGLGAQPFHLAYYAVLEAFARGSVKRLMVTMPPQHGKSHGASILLPAYILGLDPDRKIAIASYSASLANRFNRRGQRILETPEYGALFPDTRIKTSPSQGNYVRTADHVEIIGREGELFSVGREGPLTGNRVDTFILDDLYKDAMEANSPIVRENCWDWYTSVVRTRMHNDSSEVIAFTRWHDDDLIGQISSMEEVVEFRSLSQLENHPEDVWLHLNFEAIKTTPRTELDPRAKGEALWEERHSAKLLARKRALDEHRFECMYQGRPSLPDGYLYGDALAVYDELPRTVVCRGNYTDTADMGEDYLCSVCYDVADDGLIYVTDVVHTPERMERTETMVAEMLARSSGSDQGAGSRDGIHPGSRTPVPPREVYIESNNGGEGFARAITRLLAERGITADSSGSGGGSGGGSGSGGVRISTFHQMANKEARILTNSSSVVHRIRFPADWHERWPQFHHHVTSYRRLYRANRWHDAADVLTGIIEKEATRSKQKPKSRLLIC